MNEHMRSFRDLNANEFDTRTLLRNAAEQATARHYEDFFIVDVDSHHYETRSRQRDRGTISRTRFCGMNAKFQGMARGGIISDNRPLSGSHRPHHALPDARPREGPANAASRHHADGTLDECARRRSRRSCFRRRCSICELPAHIEAVVGLARPTTVGSATTSLRTTRALRLDDLPAVLRSRCVHYEMVEEFGDRKGVVGFMVTSTHYKPNFDNPLYEALRRCCRNAACRSAFHAAFNWSDQSLADDQPLHRGACARLYVVQHASHDELARQRHARAVPQAEDDVDRKRSRLDAVPDAASRQRIHDAHVGCAAAQAQAERIHARHVLHVAADGDGRQQEGARSHLRDDQRRDAAALFVRLSALGHGSAQHDLRSAVPHEQAKRNILGGNAQRLFKLEPTLSPDKLARKATPRAPDPGPEINKVLDPAPAK